MADWYYHDPIDERCGPISQYELILLAKNGVITPDTVIENEEGKTCFAKDIKGISFKKRGIAGIFGGTKRNDVKRDVSKKDNDHSPKTDGLASKVSIETNDVQPKQSTDGPSSTSEKRDTVVGCGCMILFCILLGLLMSTCNNSGSRDSIETNRVKYEPGSSSEEMAAIRYVKDVIRSQLKAPSTAKFEKLPLGESKQYLSPPPSGSSTADRSAFVASGDSPLRNTAFPA